MYGMWHSVVVVVVIIIVVIIIIIIILYSRIKQYILKVSDCTSALNIWHTQSNITSKSDLVKIIKY
jgi:archaellum component FlaF (FlaF/FlaG flagellin family)